MADVLYFPNLKASTQKANATGTALTDDQAVDRVCLDVFSRNDAANPLFVTGVAGSTFNILGQDIHDASSDNIDVAGGSYVAFGGAVTIPSGTKYVQISSTLGEPVEIAFGADATAAASSVKKAYLVEGGAPGKLEFIPATENKVFIRSLSANAIDSGYVTLIFLG